jgi:MATE family multidrug resistance protein
VLAFYLFVALRQTLQAMRRVTPIIVTMVAANVLNAALCAVLALGLLGAPRLGVAGAAWAGTVSRWFMLILLAALAARDLAPYLWPPRHGVLDRRALARMLAIGVPIGAQITLEFGVFTVVGLMMGRFGTVPVAAHQVAINIASFTFMVPLGVSGAAAVYVGHAVGRGDPAGVRRAATAALAIGVGFMTLTAATFIGIPRLLAAVYTPDAAVQALAVALLPIAGVFQVFDGTQVVCIGLLRGLGDTRAPVWINVLAFWGVGFPVSLLLGFTAGLGPRGLWWGLVVGLVGVALLLLARLRARLRGRLERVVVDDTPARPLAETPRSSV